MPNYKEKLTARVKIKRLHQDLLENAHLPYQQKYTFSERRAILDDIEELKRDT